MFKKNDTFATHRIPHKPVEKLMPGFKRKRSRRFVLNFLNTYYLLIMFLCNKYQVKPNRIISLLFSWIYVGDQSISTKSYSKLLSSGMRSQGKLIWLTFANYFEGHDIKGLSFMSVCNLIRFCETDFSDYDVKMPALFHYERGVEGQWGIELNIVPLLSEVTNFGKEVRKQKLIYRDALANDFVLFLTGFRHHVVTHTYDTLRIINCKYKEKVKY